MEGDKRAAQLPLLACRRQARLLHNSGLMFDRVRFLAMLAGAVGGALAIASMEAFFAISEFPLVAIRFAPSIVTVLGSPKAEPAQPRASIGGHRVSTSWAF